MKVLKVLAVADPAVKVYVEEEYKILENFPDSETKIIFDIVEWENYFPTLMEAFSGNQDYDIVMLPGHLSLKDYVAQHYLVPLDPCDEDILPVIAEEMNCEGTTYLSPSFCDGHMIVYRKRLMEELTGQSLKEVISPKEFITIAETLKVKMQQPPIALKAHASEIMLDALPYLRMSGYDLYEEVEGNMVCHVDKMEEGLRAYLRLKDSAPEDTHTYGNDQIKDVLAHNKVAMAVTWSGQLGAVMKDCVEPEDVGFATFDTSWNVTWSFAITTKCKNVESAKALLSYLSSEKVDQIVGAYSGAPIRRSSYLKGKEQFPWYQVQLKMIEEYAKPLVSFAGMGAKNDILYNGIYRAFIGDASVKEALKQMQDAVEV